MRSWRGRGACAAGHRDARREKTLADLSRTWRSGLGAGNEQAALAGRGAGAELEADAEAGRAADR